jgi:hypothetical protein
VSHLGERVSALIDGQLNAEATERAMAHLAGCRECRDAVEIERLTKTRLAYLCGPEPAGDLIGRLLAMGGPSGPLPPRPGHVPGMPRPKPLAVAAGPVLMRADPVRPPAGRPAAGPRQTGPGQAGPGRRPSVRRRRARLAGAVLGALGVVGAGVGGLVLTAPSITAGGLSPASDSLTVQQRTVVSVPTPGFGRRGALARGPRYVPAFGLTVPQGIPRAPVAYQTGR